MAAQSYVRLNAEQLRTLAHPLRNRILSALRSDGPSTATGVADRLGSNSGKTSYHLRLLGEVGLVVELPDRGNARERWWRAAHDITTLEPKDFADDPDATAALDYLLGRYARYAAAQTEQWLTNSDNWSREWHEAATLSDRALRLTPAQLTALNDEVSAVIDRHVDAADDPGVADDPDAVECTMIYQAFPNPMPLL